eukprot:gnl/TRDRNA2_/TRDRNA2_84778_c0_seq4.p1 gnl/TRDRNA2_/TRDRNA2_84778_c0~~gnl/TRDRNA2_/TRDRNA2_84778_c0_seq4.p1  ORF type:complete len:237 (-),score=28.16 gnl/TRDRNA2_/TRDRNA2_84778_c0_seq4:119-829(-)
MPVGDPAPLFLQAYPITLGVQVSAGIHFLISVFIVSTCSSVAPVRVSDFVVGPVIQTLLGGWHLLGCMFIAGALVATVKRDEFPLRVYLVYLCLNTIWLLALLVYIIQQGSVCSMAGHSKSTQRTGRGFDCMMVSGAWFFGAFACTAISASMTYWVWQLQHYLWEKENVGSLLRYRPEPWKRGAAPDIAALGRQWSNLPHDLLPFHGDAMPLRTDYQSQPHYREQSYSMPGNFMQG